ncbi:MAG: alpha/beta fold hydrolase [Enterococcus sp.]
MRINNGNSVVFYHEDDKNEGTPFIFLHGLGGDTGQTMGLMRPTKGLRRISMDFRGHGKTIDFGKPENFSFERFSKDVLSLADHLGLEQFYLGGISTGAGTALRVALDYPERVSKLVLSRPAWEDKPQSEDIQHAFKMIHTILQDDSILDKKQAYRQTSIYQKMNSQAEYAGSTLLSQFDYAFARETSEKLIRIPADCPNNDREEWKKLAMPTLVLASKLDPIHPYSYGALLSNYIHDAKFVEITPKEISGEKHNEDSYQAIREFLLT